jgi:DNA-binding protein WhiA
VAMTAAVKQELARCSVTKTCCRRAEVCALLRFAAGLRIRDGRVVVHVELDTGTAARRLRTQISELYGQTPDIHVVAAGGPGPGSRYVVQVLRDGQGLARQSGLLDHRGRPVRGLPSQVVSGGVCDAEAVWRGAFLARGSLTETGRSPALVITSPGPEAALALLGAARKLGVTAKTREVHGADGIVVSEADAIAALLTRLGAPCSALAWQQHRMRRQAPTTTNQPIAFGDANHRRTTQAAAEATARVQRALQVLGPDIPEHLLLVGQLRLDHPQASLEELGRLADPPMTKDTIAGRIRRLLALADNHAHHLQVPDTTTCVLTPDMPDS